MKEKILKDRRIEIALSKLTIIRYWVRKWEKNWFWWV